jgi:uncharacterized protein YndB with AHSA1/START domain/uncharacterized protein YciI
MTILPPIRRQVVVPAGPRVAFDVFTQRIGDWWPVERFSVFGAGSAAAFADGRLVETGPDGAESVWGEVLDWQPPRLLRMTWHPGDDPAKAGTVEVGFAPVGDALTLVTITHTGWEKHADPGAARAGYGTGWPGVLAGYAATVPVVDAEDAEGPVYLVLTHTPAPGTGDPFEHPGFAGHPAFLRRLQEAGVLVAAGPFPASGEGMTLLRLDGPGRVAQWLRAANEDDRSVADGILEVRARPWVVTLTGSSIG